MIKFYLLSIYLSSDIFTTTNNDPFDSSDNFFTKLTMGISRLFSILWGIIDSIIDAVQMLYDSICDLIAWMNNMIDALSTGDCDGLPLLEAIGTYRYLVGDLVFYLTYVTVVVGCLFTIYKLIMLIYSRITGMTGNGLTGALLSKM